MDIALIILTHSEYSDLWTPLFKRFEKYLNITFSSTYLCVDDAAKNEDFKKLYEPIKKVFYFSNETTYPLRFKEVLEETKESYILIWHDNNILINNTDTDSFKYIEEWINNNKPDQLRLHAGSAKLPGQQVYNDIYKMTNTDIYNYSVYPTIWKKETIKDIFNKFPRKIYKKMEEDDENGNVQEYIKDFGNYYLWNYDKSLPRGCSTEFTPHIIQYRHFIIWSQWLPEWDYDHLLDLRNEFNIDFSKRGCYIEKFCRTYDLHECYNDYKKSHICFPKSI
jgi:hypothetical protein